ncbi:uncharacterized protein LOC113474625 [Ciona intestinalis]
MTTQETNKIVAEFNEPGLTAEEKTKRVKQFIETCIEQSTHTHINEKFMITKGYVMLSHDKLLTCKCDYNTRRVDHMRQHLASHFKSKLKGHTNENENLYMNRDAQM